MIFRFVDPVWTKSQKKTFFSTCSPNALSNHCTIGWGSIGFLNVQKKSKSKRLFLTQGIPKSENFALFVKIMTQILYQKNFITFSESKYGQNHGQCHKRSKGVSDKVDFWHGENLNHAEKKRSKYCLCLRPPSW